MRVKKFQDTVDPREERTGVDFITEKEVMVTYLKNPEERKSSDDLRDV
jgi:hypothetical protein